MLTPAEIRRDGSLYRPPVEDGLADVISNWKRASEWRSSQSKEDEKSGQVSALGSHTAASHVKEDRPFSLLSQFDELGISRKPGNLQPVMGYSFRQPLATPTGCLMENVPHELEHTNAWVLVELRECVR